MTLSGDTAAVLSIVTDQTALEAAGLTGITNGYKVYDFVNNSSSATTFVGIDGLGNTNMQTSSLIARRLTGTGSTSFIGVAGNSDALITSSNYTRISGSRATVAGLLRIYCGPNSSIRFILPQLEESSVSTTPMPTAGATATRAATVNSYPTSGNLPASGVRHISLVWTPQDITAGKVQYLWSSYVSAGNYTAIWSNSVIVCLEKAVAGVSEYVTFPITPVIGTAMLVEGYIYADNTMGLAVNGVLQSGTLGPELNTDPTFATAGLWTIPTGWSVSGNTAVATGNSSFAGLTLTGSEPSAPLHYMCITSYTATGTVGLRPLNSGGYAVPSGVARVVIAPMQTAGV
jgi:hypothetical protein